MSLQSQIRACNRFPRNAVQEHDLPICFCMTVFSLQGPLHACDAQTQCLLLDISRGHSVTIVTSRRLLLQEMSVLSESNFFIFFTACHWSYLIFSLISRPRMKALSYDTQWLHISYGLQLDKCHQVCRVEGEIPNTKMEKSVNPRASTSLSCPPHGQVPQRGWILRA